MTAPTFSAEEAQAWAAEQTPPFRIRFNSKRARWLTFGRMPTITLRRTVYTEGETIRVESAIHEHRHVWQGMVNARWWWLFALGYLLDVFARNYTGSKYEEDARRYAKDGLPEVTAWLTDYRDGHPR